MFERMLCVGVCFLAIFGVFTSSKKMDVYTDSVAYQAKSNYFDVSIQNVSNENNRVSTDQIEISSMDSFTFSVCNNSSSYDAEVEIILSRDDGEAVIAHIDVLKSGECYPIRYTPSNEEHSTILLRSTVIQKEYLA